MDLQTILNIIDSLKIKGELPFVEVKDSLSSKDQIGKTLSALSNSASFYNEEFGYMIWGIENSTWNIKGTFFDLEYAKEGKSGLIYPQIIKSFNYSPEILLKEFTIKGNRIFVAKIRNCGNIPLTYNKTSYVRLGETNIELELNTGMQKEILNKNIDWSALVPEESNFDWIDEDAYQYLRDKYFKIDNNKTKTLDKKQLLNSLSLLDKDGKPNNACLLFIGDVGITKNIFKDKKKITWVYRDELNGIEERLSVDDEDQPFIFSIENILDKINKFNTTLQDIDLFRNDVSQYDKKAIEEMIINAVVHRDWNRNFWIEVVQTPIALEIRNPGRFRANLDKVLLENKRPEYLNPTLSDFLKKIKLMEKEGGGLRKSYAAQIKKGLSISLKYDDKDLNPRVDFILSGKVEDVAFARFMFMSKDLTQDQVVILDKINSGKNILNRDISNDEYLLVENLVMKTGQGGISLKIKEHLLKKSKKYINSFSNTHASADTSKEIIMDYAKKNTEFCTAEVYDILSGKTKEWVRTSIMEMIKNGDLFRVKRGVYSLVKTLQTKPKNSK